MARPKKIHHFKIVEFENPVSKTVSWRVTGNKPDGTRVRKNFADQSEARVTLADLEAEMAGHIETPKIQRTRMSHDEVADAEAALRNASGRQLSKMVSHYLNLEARAKLKGIDLEQALSFVEAHFRSETQAISVFAAYTEFAEGRISSAKKTREHYESSLRLLLKQDPNRFLHTFTVSDIEKILKRYTNVNSKRTYRRAFSTFFNWGVRHHYCLEDPCKRMDKLPSDMTQIAIMSLEEAKRLLYASATYQNGATAAVVAIGLFAGLRPSEIADLKMTDIGERGIRVSGGKLRRKLKRTVPVPPVLAAWLKVHPFTGMPEGWKYKIKTLKKARKASRWVQDIIRHTSISFQTERDKNEALTAYNCGTSPKMMDLHYRNTIDNERAITEFWTLTPAKLLAKRSDVELPTKRRINWPDKSDLKKLVWEKPLMHAAAELGASDVALRKHCVKLGITLPQQGHWLQRSGDRNGGPRKNNQPSPTSASVRLSGGAE